ncbi:hypothetical protein DFH09DRAFT_1317342 [Mycena vulgaris]|nr:hypothetical protein DFH09DRAFT_1317342 [Mycena vulgaris]
MLIWDRKQVQGTCMSHCTQLVALAVWTCRCHVTKRPVAPSVPKLSRIPSIPTPLVTRRVAAAQANQNSSPLSSPSPPPIPPRRYKSSDSSSDSSPARPSHAMSTERATCESHLSKLPTLMAGEVSPLACNEFEQACFHYFSQKDTAAEKQVAVILGCFHEPDIQNWLRVPAERTHIITLSFIEFMEELRE